MGDAKRRRDRRELQKGLQEIHAEGQGVWQMTCYTKENAAVMAILAMDGDPYASALLRVLESMVQYIWAASPPALCLTCDNILTRAAMPAAFLVVHARRDDPRSSVCNGICDECFDRYPGDALMLAATNVYREKVISGLRVLPPLSAPGSA